MVIDVQWIIFCVAMLGTAVLSNSLRFLFLKQMKQVPQAAPESELHPAELAYLFRPDDSSHCLIVLIVDLLQKGLKSPALLADELAESQYELQIWNSLKSYIKGWTMQQAESVLPELGTRNPVRIATGFWRLRKWLSGGFSSIFSDLKKDPRGLRRFFSPAGLMRVFVSVLSSGVREPLMRKLHETLLERQLLVSYTVRERYSKILSIVCCVHLLVLGVVLAFVSGIRNWEAILLLAVITAVNGFALRFLSMLPTFIPFYEELTAVLDSVQRTGFRITVLRAILKFLRTGYWSLILLGGAAIFALEALAFGQFFHLASNIWWLNLLALLALTYNFFSMADLAGLSYYIANNEQLSSKGEELRRRYHLQLKSVSPIKAFTAVLADTDYNDQLSDIVAIYGVETLFLLA